jgi:hypothetical protein
METSDTLSSDHFLYLQPGLTGLVSFAQGRGFLSADVDALIFVDSFAYSSGYPPSTRTAITLPGQVGVRF